MNKIAARRRNAGLTQKQLAQQLGITQGAVSQWENKISRPRAQTLKKLAGLLHCSVDELLLDWPR